MSGTIGAFLIFAALALYSAFGTGVIAREIMNTISGNLSASEIAVYAANAGFSGNDLTTAVAIALAESSGNPNANGDTELTPGGSVGLWQINLASHPEFAQLDLTDPQINANSAYAVFIAAGYKFTPWSTFKSGAYEANLVAANSAVQSA